MQLTSPGKLAVLMVGLIGSFGALATDHLSESAAVGIIMAIVGYVVGNGTGALRGETQAPLLAPRAKTPIEDPEGSV